MWSKLAPACLSCGTTEKKHWARGWCKTCYSRWYKKTPTGKAERKRYYNRYIKTATGKRGRANQKLREKYGITLQDKEELLASQGGLCPICFLSPHDNITQWNLDHDHITGTVRGVLCSGCNSGLGRFKDNIASLVNAQKYLEKFLPAS